MRDELRALRALLEEVLARPQVVMVEWKPDHRRIVDGGEHVATQRRRAPDAAAELRRRAVA